MLLTIGVLVSAIYTPVVDFTALVACLHSRFCNKLLIFGSLLTLSALWHLFLNFLALFVYISLHMHFINLSIAYTIVKSGSRSA